MVLSTDAPRAITRYSSVPGSTTGASLIPRSRSIVQLIGNTPPERQGKHIRKVFEQETQKCHTRIIEELKNHDEDRYTSLSRRFGEVFSAKIDSIAQDLQELSTQANNVRTLLGDVNELLERK